MCKYWFWKKESEFRIDDQENDISNPIIYLKQVQEKIRKEMLWPHYCVYVCYSKNF